MSNFLQRGVSFLARVLAARAGTTIRYRRGGVVLCEIAAVVGKTDVDSLSEDNLVMRIKVRDYLVRRELLQTSGGQPIVPQERDEIVEVLPNASGPATLLVHEVLPIDGKRAGDESDPYRELWRIHTKFVRTEA